MFIGKEFLLHDPEVNLAEIARTMWPNNTSAKTYLSRKLHGGDGRSWTTRDEELALAALDALSIRINTRKPLVRGPLPKPTSKKKAPPKKKPPRK